MPGITQGINPNPAGDNNDADSSSPNPLFRNGTSSFHSLNGSSVSSNGFWSKHRDDVSYNQLQKFWCELMPQARQNLLRIDKQTLFEHARKNMYCSRCNGLLLEGFLQIVMYGKSLQQDASSGPFNVSAPGNQNDGGFCVSNGCLDDAQDPSVHPWGGLTTARDGTLTLLDCYLYSKPLKGLQKVFDSARARERERELLYPDACGGGGRGWISQGIPGYSRGHGTRETCALHTARLSVETLVDFWSALGEETQQSLLGMKEDDFIERLMYRFDSKRFCRDCRRNVIREFKELKELKRMRRETRCTSWFCVADTAFQYEVSCDSIHADWHQTFLDSFGTYLHFEWAVGTGEGQSDILEFENVGLTGRVQVNGLDLSGLNSCYITLRAWKMDGRCNELCVKAHALHGQQCVHCRLMVGDGTVTITRGESITRFFEHAEEAEEEEDDDSTDKDGNELDGECSRPQKHAKSPELAREFLLDAATVIFKEQVEKAFREGTARQNAHSIFVSLAVKLLEERVYIACKEIITLEKQMKLLEEEEKEKREEEERRERRRTKEREKKLRRKERLREKESHEKKSPESKFDPVVTVGKESSMPYVDGAANIGSHGDSVNLTGETALSRPFSPEIQEHQLSGECTYSNVDDPSEDILDREFGNMEDWNISFPCDQIKYSRRKPKFHKDMLKDLSLKWPDRRKVTASSENGVVNSKFEARYHAGYETTRSTNGFNKQCRSNAARLNTRNDSKLGGKFQCVDNRMGDRYDADACSCNNHHKYSLMTESRIARVVRDPKHVNKLEAAFDMAKPYYRGNKYTQAVCTHHIKGRPKSKITPGNSHISKKVWEPLDLRKKCIRSNSDSDVTVRFTAKVEGSESDQLPESCSTSSDEVTEITVQNSHEDNDASDIMRFRDEDCRGMDNGFNRKEKPQNYSEVAVVVGGELSYVRSPLRILDSSMSNSSNSDNCSSCLSEGDNNMYSHPQNLESTSTSDSEESTQNSVEKVSTCCHKNGMDGPHDVAEDQNTAREQNVKCHGPASAGTNSLGSLLNEVPSYCKNGGATVGASSQSQYRLPQMHSQSLSYPIFQAPALGYYHQNPVSWPAGPTNGLMSFPPSNHYLFANPFGYCLNGSTRLVQHGALQHVTTPLINHGHVPVFQSISQVNTEESVQVAHLAGPKEAEHNISKITSTEKHPAEGPTVDNRQHGKHDKMDMGSNGFSLFHFGGPVALSTGFRKGDLGDASANLSANCSDGDYPCNKNDSVEEYNLFATTNSIKFSIF